MTEVRPKSMKKAKIQRKMGQGKSMDLSAHQSGNIKIDIFLSEIDQVEKITTSPEPWLNLNPVVPIGIRDKHCLPIYKVIRLDDRIAQNEKRSRQT